MSQLHECSLLPGLGNLESREPHAHSSPGHDVKGINLVGCRMRDFQRITGVPLPRRS